jgi:hypothetical protein
VGLGVLLEGDLAPAQVAVINLMTLSAGSVERAKAFVLVEPSEVDQAVKALPSYRAPGQ